jgi:PEP-CTERM motif
VRIEKSGPLRSIVGVAMLCAMGASPAGATAIYSYTGADFDFCVIGMSPCTPSGSVTGTMEFSSPLAANLANATVLPDAFSFSDGAFTISNSDWDAANSAFQVTTDPSGTLTGWLIGILDSSDTLAIFVVSPAIPGGYSGSDSCPIGDLINGCTNATSQAASLDGSWSAVPEPGTVLLLGSGMALLSHRRRTSAAG